MRFFPVADPITFIADNCKAADSRCAWLLASGGTILLLLVYRDLGGIKIDSVGTSRRKWPAVSSSVMFLTWFNENNEMTFPNLHPIEWYMYYFTSRHTNTWCFWACTRFEARDAGSKQNRFPYDCVITSHILTPDIIFHVRICQRTQKLLWSIDGKPEMCLVSPVWRHCWYDDSEGTWQRIL